MIFPFIISLIGLVFLLINAIRFYYFRKGKGLEYIYLMYYLIIQFFVELFCNIIGFLNPSENFFLSHFYFVIQFIMLSLFFNKVLKNTFLKKMIYINLLLVLIGLSVQYMVTPSLFWEFNNYEIGVTSILLIFYCIFYFCENLTSSYTYHFFCMGLTFYLTSSCLIFLTGNTQLVFFTEPIFLDIWILNSLFFILFQVFIFKEWQLLKSYIADEEKINIVN